MKDVVKQVGESVIQDVIAMAGKLKATSAQVNDSGFLDTVSASFSIEGDDITTVTIMIHKRRVVTNG